jgi:hypothetical protein
MQKDYSIFPIPSFAKREVEDFDVASKESLEIYQELNAIAEEIEKCRLRNS